MDQTNKVDVIIPVYRPDEKLERLIGKLNVQTVPPAHVFFMQTLTGTEEDARVRERLMAAVNAVVTPIEKKDFDHGGTRNRGAALSDSGFMLFMTQDAVPVDEFLIERLLGAMSDEDVGTAYGRQLPGDETGIIERFTRRFNYPDTGMEKSREDLPRLGIKTYFCSNVCAMYRKSIYEEMGGFEVRTIFNEDMIMAAHVIDAGYKIAYAADAQVVHAHTYTCRQQFTRNFDLAVSQRQHRDIFDRVPSESEGIRLVKETAKFLCREKKWYLIPELILQSGFKFLGYQFGRRYEKLPLWMIKKMSMNKAYWRDGR